MQDTIRETKQHFAETLIYLQDRLRSVRTGRANPQLVEQIKVQYYGQDTPLQNLAAIAVPEPTTIAITPYDKNSIDDIVLAITNAKDLGLTPSSDGTTVRLKLPSLTAERREQLVKQLHQITEEARIAFRNIREEKWKQIQAKQKAGDITEDERERGRKELDSLIEDYNQQVATILAKKEAEIATV